MGYLKERFGMALLPTKSGVCPECAASHEPEQPHNQQSLTYQYTFYDRHGRWPTWADAMAHCEASVKDRWIEELRKIGEKV
jgi:ribonuclease I